MREDTKASPKPSNTKRLPCTRRRWPPARNGGEVGSVWCSGVEGIPLTCVAWDGLLSTELPCQSWCQQSSPARFTRASHRLYPAAHCQQTLLTVGRAVGKRYLNYKQDSCKVSFPPLLQWGFFFPTPALRCSLKVADAVRQERTSLFLLLGDENIANHRQANPK